LTRFDLLPRVAQELVDALHGRDHLPAAQNGRRLLTAEEERQLLRATDDMTRFEIARKAEARALEYAVAWLSTDPRGADLIAEAEEREAEDEDELAELDREKAA
jgi:hypothetical protein